MWRGGYHASRVVSASEEFNPRLSSRTALAFMAFGVHVLSGATFEPRTVAAMTLRTGLWAGIGLLAWHFLARAKTVRRIRL